MQTATQPNSGCYDSQHDDSQLKDTQPNNKNTAFSIKIQRINSKCYNVECF
jgi:hypothetical protein